MSRVCLFSVINIMIQTLLLRFILKYLINNLYSQGFVETWFGVFGLIQESSTFKNGSRQQPVAAASRARPVYLRGRTQGKRRHFKSVQVTLFFNFIYL